MIINHTRQQIHLDNLCHKDAINNQRDIISHQHGGNKIIRIAEETRKDAWRNTRFPLHLKTEFVHGNKSNLHPRKKSGESHGYQ